MTEPVWQRVLGHVEPDADLQSLLRVPDAPKPRRDSRVVWLVILVAGTVYELWAVGNKVAGDSLTELTRWTMGTPENFRWWAVLLAVIGIALWFIPHLVDPVAWGWRQLLSIWGGCAVAALLLWLAN